MPDSPSPPGASGEKLRREWLLVLVAAVGAVLLFSYRGSGNERGMEIEVPLTLVTSDRDDLACASDRDFGGYRCGFKAGGRPWPAPPAPERTLAPYLSEARQLFLVPDLFDLPSVNARYQRELPSNVRRNRLRRFTARCKMRLVERVDQGLDTRWLATAGWSKGDVAWVALPLDCEVRG